MASFDLSQEKWISALPIRGGPVKLFSLRELLLDARQFRRIDAPSPLVTIALYRLCLAVLYRAVGTPANAAQAATWLTEGFPAGKIEAYLDQYADRFDLFHAKYPFWQVPDLTPEVEGGKWLDHWSRLRAEEGSANTTLLFNPAWRPGGERHDAVSPAEVAQELVTHQTFTLGGLIKRITTSARAASVATAALTLVQGSNLHETFCLNMHTDNDDAKDRAIWEYDPPTLAELKGMYDPERPGVAGGIAEQFTWLSRAIRLHPEQNEQGQTVVRQISYAAGKPQDNAINSSGRTPEPMLALLPGRNTKEKEASLFPQKLKRAQFFWRDFTALLPDAQNQHKVLEDKAGQVQTMTVKGVPPGVLRHAREVVLELQKRKAVPQKSDDAINYDDWDDASTPVGMYRRAMPISVFGQITDQGKAFSSRQEQYTLPQAFIDDDQTFSEQVSKAIQEAEDVGSGLREAIRHLVYETLKRGEDRKPPPEEVKKLMDQLPAEKTYWARLESPFRHYLASLDESQKASLQWRQELRLTALNAWALAQEGMGESGAALRAGSMAQKYLWAALKPLKLQETPT